MLLCYFSGVSATMLLRLHCGNFPIFAATFQKTIFRSKSSSALLQMWGEAGVGSFIMAVCKRTSVKHGRKHRGRDSSKHVKDVSVIR